MPDYARMYHGDSELKRLYMGGELVWEKPCTYRRIAYLKSTGTQYILTDIVPDYTMRCEAVCTYGAEIHGTTHEATSEYREYRTIFGFTSWHDATWAVVFDGGVQPDTEEVMSFYNGYTWRDTLDGHTDEHVVKNAVVTGSPFRVVLSGSCCAWGALTCDPSGIPVTLENPTVGFPVFGSYFGDDDAVHPFKKRDMYLYSLRLLDSGGETVCELLPVERSDGELGLLDSVSGKFYANAGSGAFGKGGYLD